MGLHKGQTNNGSFKKGQKPSDISREKMSATHIKLGTRPPSGLGKKYMLGRKYSKEWKENIGKAQLGKKRSEVTKQKMRESRIANGNQNQKFKDTKIELKIEKELQNRNIIYQKQVPLAKTTIVDFFLPEYNIVIQADGCYWHNCPTCKRFNFQIVTKDKYQDSILTLNGFTVYRFWEHEINQSVEDCISKINLTIV